MPGPGLGLTWLLPPALAEPLRSATLHQHLLLPLLLLEIASLRPRAKSTMAILRVRISTLHQCLLLWQPLHQYLL